MGNALYHPFSSQNITFISTVKRGSHQAGQQNIMAKFPTVRIRTRRKYYRLIFTFLMALMMSTIISTALLLINVGFFEGFFTTLFHSWKYAFIVAWPSAYICAYLIQEHLLSRIEFY
ncbi:DUF2798 domain-containing protein [Psychrobacter sp. 1U2]|uniref:DUF2798 domain-containing protein n=1 Tax=Psychrobacter sp. 1U2 TaxID=3453577 RepID=UPI003F6DFBA2